MCIRDSPTNKPCVHSSAEIIGTLAEIRSHMTWRGTWYSYRRVPANTCKIPRRKYRRGYYQVTWHMAMQVDVRMAHAKYGGTHLHAKYLKYTLSAIQYSTKTNGYRYKRNTGTRQLCSCKIS